MKRLAIIPAFCLFLFSCGETTQQEETPATAEDTTAPVPPVAKNIEDFVPAGFKLFKSYPGNLNKDAYEDMVVVMDAIDTGDEMINRGVMLLTGDAAGNMTVAAMNKEGALCGQCGGAMGDPFMQAVIKDGFFTLEHMGGAGWRWTDYPTFKYNEQDGKWYLHRRNRSEYHSGDPERTEKKDDQTTKDFGVVNFEDFRY